MIGYGVSHRNPDAYHDAAARQMAMIDRLPRKMRMLVHEFGWKAVEPYLGGNMPPIMVREVLRAKRARRQEAMLGRCA